MADEEDVFENAEKGKIVENDDHEKELVRDDVIKEKIVESENIPKSKEGNGDLKGKGEEGKNEVVKDEKEIKNGGLENEKGVEENGDVKKKEEGQDVVDKKNEFESEEGIAKGVDEEGETKKIENEKDESKKIDKEKDEAKKIENEKEEAKKIDKEKDEVKKTENEKDESKKIDEEKEEEPKKIENEKDESKKIDEEKDEPKKNDMEKEDESKKIDEEKDEAKKIGEENDESKKIDKGKDEPKKENDESKKIDEVKNGSKKEGKNNTRGYEGIGKTKKDEKINGANQENTQSNKVDQGNDASKTEDEMKENGDQEEGGSKKEDENKEEERDDAISCNVDVNNISFTEQANQFSELKVNEKSALVELKTKLEEAIKGNSLYKEKTPPNNLQRKGSKLEGVVEEAIKKKQEESKKPDEGEKDQQGKQEQDGKGSQDSPPKDEAIIEEKNEAPNIDIALWGIPLLPSKGDNQTDVLLLKFLRARDYKAGEAFEMLRNTLLWRKKNNIDSILDEDFANDFSSAAYMRGVDNEGHPVCYNIFGALDNNEMYNKTLSSEEKQDRFLRWRIQLMEEGIQKLDFSPTGVSSLLQISDLKNTPGPSKKEVRLSAKQGVSLLLDNYPEFVAKHIFINVPFWYYAFTAVLSPFLNARTKSKFVYARPAKVMETLLKYIAIEELPVQYGGLKREIDPDFSHEDNAIEVPVKAGSTETIELLAPKAGQIVWDLTVLGWEVSYKEEFVPTDEGSYTIIVQKGRKIGAQDESIRNSFRSNEPGKIVISIDNSSFKKKRVFYRYKSNTSSSSS